MRDVTLALAAREAPRAHKHRASSAGRLWERVPTDRMRSALAKVFRTRG